MNLAVVLSKRKKRNGPIASAIEEASKRLNFRVKYIGESLRGFRNVIFFVNRPEHIGSDMSFEFEKEARVGWWMCDYRPVSELEHKKLHPRVSNIFLCNTQLLQQYRKQFKSDVYYMPQCGHKFEDKISSKRRLKNIVFIGSIRHPRYHTNRMDYLMQLQKLGVSHIHEGKTSYDMSSIYRRVPISLSISLPFEGYTSNRLYNILAGEGFALVLYYPGIENQFENGKHLVWFKDEKEAEDLARYYLKNKKERVEIARQGNLLYRAKHKAEHRINNMLDIMQEDTDKFYGYLNKYYEQGLYQDNSQDLEQNSL
jgi:hypothetical protein